MKHKIIQTENYLLIVDDLEIKEGDYYLFTWGGEQDIQRFQNQQDDRIKHQHLYETACKKIIAHLPLNNSPILDGVDLLPPLEDDEVEKFAVNNANDFYEKYRTEWEAKKNGFIDGYQKAREKYKWSDDDLIKAIEMATTSKYDHRLEFYTHDEIIQSLKQPKIPIEFECKIDNILSYNVEDGINALVNPNFGNQKTIINSQGLTQWVGTYLY